MATAGPEQKSTLRPSMQENRRIVFFDGECGLCNGFVRRVILRDTRQLMHFAPLQGSTAEALGAISEGPPESWSIVFWEDDVRYCKSTAVLRIGLLLPGWRFLSKIGLLIPKVVRDWVYTIIARYRFRIFGKVDSCYLGKHLDISDRILP